MRSSAADVAARCGTTRSAAAGLSDRPFQAGGSDRLEQIRIRTKTRLLRQGRRHCLSAQPRRHGARGQSPVFGANVLLLVYGDAFWKTYTEGDNSGLVATDSMKNFIQRETMNFDGNDLEEYCRFLGRQVSWPVRSGRRAADFGVGNSLCRRSAATWRLLRRARPCVCAPRARRARGIVEAVSGVRGFKLLRLGGSAFQGFVRDEYTTLPDLNNRPLHMWLDLEWSYVRPEAAFSGGTVDRAGAANCPGCVHVVRVREHSAGHLSYWHEDAR